MISNKKSPHFWGPVEKGGGRVVQKRISKPMKIPGHSFLKNVSQFFVSPE